MSIQSELLTYGIDVSGSDYNFLVRNANATVYETTLTNDGNLRKIIDGDTVRTNINIDDGDLSKGKVTIRLTGIDADDLSDYLENRWTIDLDKITPVDSAVKAAQKLSSLVEDNVVVVDTGTGTFGRRISLIFNKSDKKCVNWELLKTGLVTSYSYLPHIINRDVWYNMSRSRKNDQETAEDVVQSYKELYSFVDDYHKEELDDGDGSNLLGKCKIGLTWLPVSAKNIHVVEQAGNKEIPTLRTPGSPMIKTNILNKRIELTVLFPSVKHMNTKMRPLLAQFIRSPFLPIENDDIWNMIYGEAVPRVSDIHKVDSQSEISAEVSYDIDEKLDVNVAALKSEAGRSLVGQRENLRHQIKEKEDNIKRKQIEIDEIYQTVLNETNRDYAKVFKATAERAYISSVDVDHVAQIANDLDLTEPYVRSVRMDILQTRGALLRKAQAYHDFIEKIDTTNVEKEIEELTSDIKDLNKYNFYKKVLDDIDNGDLNVFDRIKDSEFNNLQLVCGLQEVNVATVPGFPDVIQCILILDVFNYSAYSPVFKYCKTHDDVITQALFYDNRKKYFDDDTKNEVNTEDLLNIKSTNNISDCEPFKDYIRPLLTGLPFSEYSEDNDIHYTFWAPENWLRPVKDESEFKKFRWELDLTELSLEEKLSFLEWKVKNDAKIDIMVKRLSNGIGYDGVDTDEIDLTDAFKALKYMIDEVWEGAKRGIQTLIAGSEQQVSLLEMFKQSLTGVNNEERKITLPFTIYYKKDDTKKITRNEIITVKEFIDFIEGIEYQHYTGKDLVRLIERNLSLEERLKYGQTIKHVFEFKESESLVVTGMSAAMRTRMAEIPVLSHLQSTKQYMGRGNWEFEVNFQTANKNFLRILSTLSRNATVSNITRQRSNADWFVYKNNAIYLPPDIGMNGFFKMLGVNNILFESFDYSTMEDKPGWWNISVRFVQADVKISEFEKLIPWNPMIEESLARKMLDIFYSKYEPPMINSRNQSGEDVQSNLKFNFDPGIRYMFNNMRNIMTRILLHFGHGNTDINGIDDLHDRGWTTEAYNMDSQIYNIYSNEEGFNEKNVLKAVHELYVDPLLKKFRIGQTNRLTNNKVKTPVNSQVDFDIIFEHDNWKNMYIDSLSYVLSESDIYSNEGEKLERWGGVTDMSEMRITRGRLKFLIEQLKGGRIVDIPFINLSFNDIMGDRWVINSIEFYLKQCLIKAILFDRDGVVKFLSSDNKHNIDWETKITDYHSSNQINSVNSVKYYGCYADLELPYSENNVIFPADFYYLKPAMISSDGEMKNYLEEMLKFKYKYAQDQAEAFYDMDSVKFLKAISNEEDDSLGIIDRILKEEWLTPETSIMKEKFNVTNVLNFSKDFDKKDLSYITDPNEYRQKINNLMNKINEVIGVKGQQFLSSNKRETTETPEELLNILKYNNLIKKKPQDGGRNAILMTKKLMRLFALSNDISARNSKNEKSSVDLKDKEYMSLLFDITSLGSLPPAELENWGVSTPYNIAKTAQIYAKTQMQFDEVIRNDNFAHLCRAFPAAKIFFIEEDNENWGMIDDYYMYNFVNGIDVVMSEDAASKVATISLMNITGNLNRKDAVFEYENPSKDGYTTEQNVENILLREGAMIMIAMGYSNNPVDLTKVFTGRIVSIEPGEQINIVAQSYGSEMHEKANNGKYKNYGATDKAVTHGDVLIDIVNEMQGLNNFGNTTWWDKLGIRNKNLPFLYTSPKKRLNDMLLGFMPVLGFYYKFGLFDPRFENIYLPFTSKDPGLFNSIGRFLEDIPNFFTSEGKFRGWTFDWTINSRPQGEQSLWDVMREMALYRHDHIVTTLPYNEYIPGLSRETIYFGPRDGLYKYTDIYDEVDNDTITRRVQERAFDNMEKRMDVSKLFAPENKQDVLRVAAPGLLDMIFGYQSKNMQFIRNNISYIIRNVKPLIENKKIIYNNTSYSEREIKESYDFMLGFYDDKIGYKIEEGSIDLQNYSSDSIRDFADKLNLFFSKYNIKKTLNDFKQGRLDSFMMLYDMLNKLQQHYNDYKESSLNLTTEGKKDFGYLRDKTFFIDNPSDLYYEEEGEWKIEKGYKPVINYHYVDSLHHIIDNNIRASSEELFNKVNVIFPKGQDEDPTFANSMSYVVDDDLKTFKTYNTEQVNIDPPGKITTFFNNKSAIFNKSGNSWKYGFPRHAIVGHNVLANTMRPMYRGELILIGNPNIKQLDIIFINDYKNNMWGPIQVEEVIHRYNSQGFITIVKPKAVVEALNPRFKWELEMKNQFFTVGLSRFLLSFGTDMLASSAIVGGVGAGLNMAGLDKIMKNSILPAHIGGRTTGGMISPGMDYTAFFANFTKTLGAFPFISNTSDPDSKGSDKTNFDKYKQMFVPLLTGVGSVAISSPTYMAVASFIGFGSLYFGASLLTSSVSKMLGRECIDIHPLWYQGHPFVAGIEGMRKNTMMVQWIDNITSLFRFSKGF